MDRDSLALRMIREAARRQNLPLDERPVDLGAFGEKPRIGAILDRLGQNAPRHLAGDETLALGPYLFHPAESYLENETGRLRLTEKERDILLALFDAGGSIDRQALLDSVWGYADGVETHTLETHIYRLRQKIEKDPAHPEILLTREDGYVLGV